MRDNDKIDGEVIQDLKQLNQRVPALEETVMTLTAGGSPESGMGTVSGPEPTRIEKGENDLRKSKETIEALLNATTDMVFLLEPDGTVVTVNERGAKFLGKSKQKLVGATIFDFFPPDLAATRREKVQEVSRTGQPAHFEDSHYVTHFENSFYPVLGKKGVERIAVYAKDITERKRAEQELRESKERYKLLVDMMSEGLVVQDEEGTITYVNGRLAEMLGHPQNEMIGRKVPEFLDKPNRARLHAQMSDSQQQAPNSCEIEWTQSDGGTTSTIVSPKFIRSQNGRLEGSFAVITDITERKKTEEALRESEKKYRTLFEQSTDAILIVNRGGEITDANASCAQLFGVAKSEIVGVDIHHFCWDPGDRAAFLQKINRRDICRDLEWKVRSRDGNRKICLFTSSAWKDDRGAVLGYLGIARDITKSKLLEEQLMRAQRMEAVGTLAGGIAHDFNNLLQVVQGYSDMALLDVSEGQPGHPELLEIRKAARSAAELTASLLTFSRRVDSRLRPVNLNHELKQVVKMLRRTIPKLIEIDLRLAANLQAVNADPAQLQLVIMNLGVNARDAMPDGGKLVIETQNVHLDAEYCKSHLGTDPGRYVVLAVSDTGFGMDKKSLDRIYEPFFTTKEIGEGTGLGLAIVYGIVKNHGGNIICYSEPSKGTSFKIYLPVASAGLGTYDNIQSSLLTGGTETILLVDDEEPVRRLGQTILKRFGYSVLCASNGREGLEIFLTKRDTIDLVILDLMMPEMGGRECLKKILSLRPSARVLIASGFYANGQIDIALEEGALASINKPYETRQMLGMVRQVLDES